MDKFLSQYGPTALVTGASSGIGEQFARILASKGFNLLLTARSQSTLDELCSELSKNHAVEVSTFAADLSIAADVEALIEKALAMDLGLIVSNAGFGLKGDFLSHDHDQVEQMYQTNSVAPSKLAYALLPNMVVNKRGGIVFTGSIEGCVPFPYSAPYAASKAFMRSLANSLWLEMQPHNVDVLLLAPGSTDTQAPIKQGMSRKQLIGLLPPEVVAAKALQCLGNKMEVTPGKVSNSFIGFLKMLPRKMATKMAGNGMKQAIESAAKQQ